MARQLINNVKLGLFVTAAIAFLVVMLYMIGKDQNLFGSNIVLKARFVNASGLIKGNNVRYSGFQVGTVKSVTLINDTSVEVLMLVSENVQKNIRKNAIVSIGTEGFIGNKIVNIIPGRGEAAPVTDGDLLASKKIINTDEMLETLQLSNRNIAVISEELKSTVHRINTSTALWKILNDPDLPDNIKHTASNIQEASAKANSLATKLDNIITDIQNGHGTVGALLKDSTTVVQLHQALQRFQEAGVGIKKLSDRLDSVVSGIQFDINNGKGLANALLKDSIIVAQIHASLENIEEGTDRFNQNMEALKHNFIFRGYFRKLEKKQKK